MTFTDYLPGIIVLGYALMAVLLYIRGKLVPRQPSGDRKGHTATTVEVNPARRGWARAATWTAVVIAVATTLVWLLAAVGIDGLLVILGVLVGLCVLGLVITFVVQNSASGGRAVVAVGFLLLAVADFWFALLGPLLYLTGLTAPVELRITDVHIATGRTTGSYYDGTYTLDGSRHHLEQTHWLAPSGLPAEGETIQVGLSPIWPFPVIEGAGGAWLMIGIGVVPVAVIGLGVWLVTVVGNRRARA